MSRNSATNCLRSAQPRARHRHAYLRRHRAAAQDLKAQLLNADFETTQKKGEEDKSIMTTLSLAQFDFESLAILA